MDRTSIQDFQLHHNPHTIPQAKNPESRDHPIESIEQHTSEDGSPSASLTPSSDPDDAIFNRASHPASPATSRHSSDDISTLPSSPHPTSPPSARHPPSPFTPLNPRFPFRNPSSIRALQMDTTPPPYLISPSSPPRAQLLATSRNPTPQSTRSHPRPPRSPSKLHSAPNPPPKKEHPLILLHITLLPPQPAYPPSLLARLLPPPTLHQHDLLLSKLTPTVLARGILIPHPRDDYDLLEERLLEALDLCPPRILPCGHFHHAESTADDDLCGTCNRRIQLPARASPPGSWDIKVYAANGLMRRGAWGAAWREMERVDAEVAVGGWGQVRRELEGRRRELEEGGWPHPDDLVWLDEPPRDDDAEALGRVADLDPDPDPDRALSAERRREIYGLEVGEGEVGVGEGVERGRGREEVRGRGGGGEVPLGTLLRNYVVLAARDARNVVIVVLSLLVLALALTMALAGGRPVQAVAMTGVAEGMGSVVEGIRGGVGGVREGVANVVEGAGSGVAAVTEGVANVDVFAAVKSGAAVVGEVVGLEVDEGVEQMEMGVEMGGVGVIGGLRMGEMEGEMN